ncbi:MAG: hypothetical protein IJI53_05385 [Clostridia bacterium]|nr:hypothetical protein [Clostridia bacterium]MBR0407448.1 hypothetical protein [Clostridia bacterium]
MLIFHSIPAMVCLLSSLIFALLCRLGKAGRWTGFVSMLLSGLMIILTLMAGGSLHEGLAYLLPPLWLLLPREARHEL